VRRRACAGSQRATRSTIANDTCLPGKTCDERNKYYDPRYDTPGRRFRIEEQTNFTFFVQATATSKSHVDHSTHELIQRALAEDIGPGDVTARLLPESLSGTAELLAKSELAGGEVFAAVFRASIRIEVGAPRSRRGADEKPPGHRADHRAGPLDPHR
jgi:hypothetical protein